MLTFHEEKPRSGTSGRRVKHTGMGNSPTVSNALRALTATLLDKCCTKSNKVELKGT